MSSTWLDRRRTERFADLLDADDAGPRHHRRSTREEELVGLVRLAEELSHLTAAPDPDPEFRGSLRAFLMATAEREGIGASADTARTAAKEALGAKTQVVAQVQPTTTSGRTRLALLAGATVGALVLSGVSLASTDSLPGDALYQVKLSAERAQLAMAGSDVGRGQLYLEFASARLAEARRVDHGQLAAALAEMDRETKEGVKLLTAAAAAGDLGALDSIKAFLERQGRALTDLERGLPVDDRADAALSLALLDKIESRVRELTAALAKPCPSPRGDDLGVDPRTC